MFSNLIEDWARGIARVVVRIFVKTPLTPNRITVIGFLLNIPVAYVLANGWFLLGGLLILFAGVFDMLDGALAKITGRASTFGAFLDSSLDRYSEAVVFLGLLLYYRNIPDADKDGGSILVYVSISGSFMISYVKARAEGLGLQCKMGLLPRPERVVLIALGTFISAFWSPALPISLWILAVGTNLTAFQRIIYIWMQTNRENRAKVQSELETHAENKQEARPSEDEEGEPTRKRWSFKRAND
ncbi:CDP-alcohol phosphatidyltransferase family protein [Candidatus Chlorohelix sp.]|uniref:CDP-alcohol phosphatidyltransferase family protein n=1 Tax=Candidatus Chlorohelix sp. TaxID=3139201 RepID=UPI00306E49E2